MFDWIKSNLAPISFFTLVLLAIIGIFVSGQNNIYRARLILDQKNQITEKIRRSDNFLLSRYNTKTTDYETFAEDIKASISELSNSKKDISPTPNDEHSNRLRQNLNQIIDFKIEQYQKIELDIKSYGNIYDDLKVLGGLKRAILNPDKLPKAERIEKLNNIISATQTILSYYKNDMAVESSFYAKIEKDLDLIIRTKASLESNEEIQNELLNEINTNFGPDENGEEQWPAEQPEELFITESDLGINDSATLIKDLNESAIQVRLYYQI